MPKSRSRREEDAKHFAGDKKAAAAFSRMSAQDRIHANTELPWVGRPATPQDIKNRNQRIRSMAGSPGAFTTGPGEDIRNARRKNKRARESD